MNDLEKAWQWRTERGIFEELRACRVFYGPGESENWQDFAIDRFEDSYWITCWGESSKSKEQKCVEFLKSKGADQIVLMGRKAPNEQSALVQTLWAKEGVSRRFEVQERRGTQNGKFWIQFEGVKHPGLFLDHAPLRQWLTNRAKGLRVLNTFSYTGSLSVAAGLGGAQEVTTLDLSKSVIRWAEENWKLNGLPEEKAKFIAGDVFEWLPRFKKIGAHFDCVILDPPSFSRGNKGTFSTQKDLVELHALALDLLGEGGILITSINSENVTHHKFESEVLEALHLKKRQALVLAEIGQPDTFPTGFGPHSQSERYLKGWILRIDSGRSSSGKGASKRSHSPDMGWSKRKRHE